MRIKIEFKIRITKEGHRFIFTFSQELFYAMAASSRINSLAYEDVKSVETVKLSEIKRLISHDVYFIYDGEFLTIYDEEEGRTGTIVQLSAFLSRVFVALYLHWFHG